MSRGRPGHCYPLRSPKISSGPTSRAEGTRPTSPPPPSGLRDPLLFPGKYGKTRKSPPPTRHGSRVRWRSRETPTENTFSKGSLSNDLPRTFGLAKRRRETKGKERKEVVILRRTLDVQGFLCQVAVTGGSPIYFYCERLF